VSKKLMSLVLGFLVAAQMSMAVAETQAPEQTKEEKKEVVIVAQQIEKLVEGAVEEGLSKEAATALVVEKIKQNVKVLTGTSMLSDQSKKILCGVTAGIACLAFLIWVRSASAVDVTLENPTRDDINNLMNQMDNHPLTDYSVHLRFGGHHNDHAAPVPTVAQPTTN